MNIPLHSKVEFLNKRHNFRLSEIEKQQTRPSVQIPSLKFSSIKFNSEFFSDRFRFLRESKVELPSTRTANRLNSYHLKDINHSFNLDSAVNNQSESSLYFVDFNSQNKINKGNSNKNHNRIIQPSIVTKYLVKSRREINNGSVADESFTKSSRNMIHVAINFDQSNLIVSPSLSQESNNDQSVQSEIVKNITVNKQTFEFESAINLFSNKNYVRIEDFIGSLRKLHEEMIFMHQKMSISPSNRYFTSEFKTNKGLKNLLCCLKPKTKVNIDQKKEISLLSFFNSLNPKTAHESEQIHCLMKLFSINVQFFFKSVKFGVCESDEKYKQFLLKLKLCPVSSVWVQFNDTGRFDKIDFVRDLSRYNGLLLISFFQFVKNNFEIMFELNFRLGKIFLRFIVLFVEFFEIYTPIFYLKISNSEFLHKDSVLKSFGFYFEQSFFVFLKKMLAKSTTCSVCDLMNNAILFIFENIKQFRNSSFKIEKQDFEKLSLDEKST